MTKEYDFKNIQEILIGILINLKILTANLPVWLALFPRDSLLAPDQPYRCQQNAFSTNVHCTFQEILKFRLVWCSALRSHSSSAQLCNRARTCTWFKLYILKGLRTKISFQNRFLKVQRKWELFEFLHCYLLQANCIFST